MLTEDHFTHVSIYTEGLNVTETADSIAVASGSIYYNEAVHPLESVQFTKEPDASYPVYYQLSIVDNDGALGYDLERTIITPRHIPGYLGSNLIHVLVSFMLDVDGMVTGTFSHVSKVGGEADGEGIETATN
jgi:hypothetical protein